MMSEDIIIRTDGLMTWFTEKNNFFTGQASVVKAVDDVSLKIREGESLGLVGESGCGKSTLGRTILNLIPATEGKVFYRDENLLEISNKKMHEMRRKLQLIFQDPYSSLNPRMTIRESIEAPLKVYHVNKRIMKDKVSSMMQDVGLNEKYLDRFPHEFSGGQRQRIMIARALILEPEFVVCDEPVSALDVSVRAQVLNLMRDLQIRKNLTYLFISHDLSVVQYISDRIAVMYLGEIIELAETEEIFRNPLHPYTEALISAIPVPDVDSGRSRIHLQGDVPDVYNMPAGCKFHTRCPYCIERCRSEKPLLREISDGHFAACHKYDQAAGTTAVL